MAVVPPPGLMNIYDVMPIAEDNELGNDVVAVENGLMGTQDPVAALQMVSRLPSLLKRTLIEIARQGSIITGSVAGFKAQL